MKQLTLMLPLAALMTARLFGQPAAERSFATPQEAAQALVDAAGQNDTAALMKLFGPQGSDIVRSGDPAEDKDARAEFARRAHEKMQVQMGPSNPNRAVIIAGNDNWPLPIPLVREKGKESDQYVWRFDTKAGKDEIINRRVGRNELDAIQTCLAIGDAQREYAIADPDRDGIPAYAQKFISDPGRKNGLYWETGEGETPSPLGPLVAEAAAQLRPS